MTAIPLPDGSRAHLIITEYLRCIANVSVVTEQPNYQRINKNTLYTLLPGVLLSECERLGLSHLSKNLTALFWKFLMSGIWSALTLLCWYEPSQKH